LDNDIIIEPTMNKEKAEGEKELPNNDIAAVD